MTKHSPSPWNACNKGKCKCKQVWTANHPIAKVEAGKWGDSHWQAKLIDGEAKLVWEDMSYGEIPEEVAIANALLIAAAPELLEAIQRIFAEPYGCPFCDSGILRGDKPHIPECGFELARLAHAKATGQENS